jgi:hypothetical protein
MRMVLEELGGSIMRIRANDCVGGQRQVDQINTLRKSGTINLPTRSLCFLPRVSTYAGRSMSGIVRLRSRLVRNSLVDHHERTKEQATRGKRALDWIFRHRGGIILFITRVRFGALSRQPMEGQQLTILDRVSVAPNARGYSRARDIPALPDFATLKLSDPLFPDELPELQRDQMMTALLIFVLSVSRKRYEPDLRQNFALLAQIDYCLGEEKRIQREQKAHEERLIG